MTNTPDTPNPGQDHLPGFEPSSAEVNGSSGIELNLNSSPDPDVDPTEDTNLDSPVMTSDAEDVDVRDEPLGDPEIADEDIDIDDEESNDLSFAFFAFALLVLVGASVYFVGTLLNTEAETAAAAESANEVIENFDSGAPFATVPPEEVTPSTLPLADDTTDDPVEAPVEEEEEDTSAIPIQTVDPEDLGIVFVNRAPGDDYGRVGYIDRAGERQQTRLGCFRIDQNANGGLCLQGGNGFTHRALVLDEGLNAVLRFGITDPSRSAASPDGEFFAWTGFVTGHDYLSPGQFSTTTQLIELERGLGVDLENDFTLLDANGERLDEPTRNYWGVTFVDSNRFYATLGLDDGSTSLVEGSINDGTLQVAFENANCPEVSPDGTTIVAKERRGDHFQVIAIDVATGERRDLEETRSVEDQVEFLDDSTIIYGLPNEAEGTPAQPASDVWALDLDGGAPQLIIPFAASPAAI